MAVKFEKEGNDTIQTATKGAFLSKFAPSSYLFFKGDVQMFDPAWGIPGEKYDPIDYYQVKHTNGLQTVKLDTGIIADAILDTREAGIVGAEYHMFIGNAGSFSGPSIEFRAVNSYTYHSETIKGAEFDIQSLSARTWEAYQQALETPDSDEASGYHEMDLLVDVNRALAVQSIVDRVQERTGEDYGAGAVAKDLDNLEMIVNTGTTDTVFGQLITEVADSLRDVLGDWGDVHYFVATKGKLKEYDWAKLPEVVWHVNGKKGAGYVSFSGSLTHQTADFESEFLAASTDLFKLTVQKEKSTRSLSHDFISEDPLDRPHGEIEFHHDMLV